MTAQQQEWRKSSRSADTSNCVEVRSGLDGLRDTKNPNGGVLAVSITPLIAAVKAEGGILSN